MNAQEIHKLNELCQGKALNTKGLTEHSAALWSLGLSLFAEAAAQLAEANEHLAKIANPLMVVNQPRWVWFKYNAFRYVVDAREVASISVPDPNHCVIIMRNEGGPDPGRFCEGSYEEVCTKLGIPTEEGK
jgi:hypothetical protein